MKNTLWVLGAPDPEMERIEALLRGRGGIGRVVYATDEAGHRVHGGNSYGAAQPEGLLEAGRVILVECGGAESSCDWTTDQMRRDRIDHHRCLDFGYDHGPTLFFRGSSLGQVLSWIGADPSWPIARTPDYGSDGYTTEDMDAPVYRNRDCTAARSGYCWQVADYHGFDRYWREVPEDLVLAAAADHCPRAAYAGECPGVDPKALGDWRMESRARFRLHFGAVQELDEDQRGKLDLEIRLLKIQVDAAQGHLRNSFADLAWVPGSLEHITDLRPGKSWIPCEAHGDECPGDRPGCWGDIPELPEAGMRAGIAYLAQPKPGRDGRAKIVLGCASPEQVQAFLDGKLYRRVCDDLTLAMTPKWLTGPEQNVSAALVDKYGVPARGYAGGYHAAPRGSREEE